MRLLRINVVAFEGLADPQRLGDLRLQRGKDQGVLLLVFCRSFMGCRDAELCRAAQRISAFFVRFLVWSFLACSLVGEALFHRFA